MHTAGVVAPFRVAFDSVLGFRQVNFFQSAISNIYPLTQGTQCDNIQNIVDYYKWDFQKNEKLKIERGIRFEQIVMHIERGDVLDLVTHPNQEKYPGQQIIVIEINAYTYLVPFKESSKGKFLKTIIPSRKATRDYLEGKNEQDKTW